MKRLEFKAGQSEGRSGDPESIFAGTDLAEVVKPSTVLLGTIPDLWMVTKMMCSWNKCNSHFLLPRFQPRCYDLHPDSSVFYLWQKWQFPQQTLQQWCSGRLPWTPSQEPTLQPSTAPVSNPFLLKLTRKYPLSVIAS